MASKNQVIEVVFVVVGSCLIGHLGLSETEKGEVLSSDIKFRYLSWTKSPRHRVLRSRQAIYSSFGSVSSMGNTMRPEQQGTGQISRNMGVGF
jgi:hypothetical protein